jgi:hypothetical protein
MATVNRSLVPTLLGCVLQMSLHLPARALDSSYLIVSDSMASLTLKRVRITEDHQFVATFELSNKGFAFPLVFAGLRRNGIFEVVGGDSDVQSLDINSAWTSLQGLAAPRMTSHERLVVPQGTAAMFDMRIMAQDIANRGEEFRVLVCAIDTSLCVPSQPFHTLPQREAVTGFE